MQNSKFCTGAKTPLKSYVCNKLVAFLSMQLIFKLHCEQNSDLQIGGSADEKNHSVQASRE